MKLLRLLLLFILVSGVGISAFGQVTEDFETTPPTGWTFYEADPADPGFVQTSAQAHGGTYSFYKNDDNIAAATDAWMVSPAYTCGANDQLVFWYRQNHSASYYDYNGVWISTASNDPITNPGDFTELMEFGSNSSEDVWTEIIENLAAYNGQTIYIAFKYTGDWADELYIDDFSLDAVPSCLDPTALSASSVMTTSASLDWTANSSETDWEIVVQAAGTGTPAAPYGTGTAISTKPHAATGLTANTAYEYYVRADCNGDGSDLSDWAGPFAFTTPCVAVADFSINFDAASSLPDCTQKSGTTGSVYTSTSYSNSGSRALYMYTPGATYVLPTTSNTGDATHWLKLYARTSSGTTSLKIGYMTDPDDAGTFTELQSISVTNSFTEFIIQPGATPSNGDYLAIQHTAYTSTYIDDIVWEEIPACIAPINLSMSSITATGGTAGWDIEATATNGYNWEVVPTGNGQGTGVVASGTVGVGVNSASVTGLTANTTYDLYVQSDCGGNGMSWSSAYTFTTSCAAVSTFPYTEDFDGTLNNNVWSCWKVINANSDSYMWSQANTYISPAHSGTYAAHGMGNNDDYLITPQLTVGANALRIRFWDKVESSTRNNTYTVKVSTTGTDAADFTTDIITIDCSNTSWTEHVVDLSAYTNQSIYVAFHQTYSASTNYGFGIDDFTAEEIPACEPVTALGAASITTTTADLSWTQGASSETAWEIAIQAQGTGTPAGAGTAVSSGLVGTTVTYNATSLTPNTAYEFYIRADCGGGDFSTWVGPVNFTTIATCLAPSALTSGTITETTAVLDWTSGGSGESTWEVAVQAQGTGTPAGAGTSTGTKPYTAMSLTGGTDYEFYVRADCGGGDFSDWSGPHNFTTYPTPPTIAQGVTCTTPGGASTVLFTEDFEVTPSGWTGSINGGNGTWEIPDGATSSNTGADDGYNGGNYMNYEASNTSTNQGSIVSPAIDLSVASDDAELSFWMHAYGASMGTLEVGVGTSASGPFTNEFTWTGQYQRSGSEDWINVGVDLSAYVGQTIYIQFTQIDDNNGAGDGYNGDMSIDEMSVTACVVVANPPNCDAAMTSPTDAATNVAINSDISWSLATGFPTGYKLQIGTTMGGSEFLAQTDVGNVLTYDPASDFAFNTTYYVNITPYNANGDATTGCTEYSFTTASGCATATTPADAATDISLVSSTSWSAITGVSGYKVSIGTTAGGTDIVNAADNGTATTYDMSGASLVYSTTYYLTIVAYNNVGDATGCASTSFTTMADPTVTPPYNESFEGTFLPVGWAIAKTSGNDWLQNTTASNASDGSKSARYSWNSSQAADSWLFTTPVALEAGKTYIWSFDQRVASSSYPENLKFTVGTAQTMAGQTTTLYDGNGLTNTAFEERTGNFTAPSTGTYYFAFQAYSAADQYTIYVDNLNIEEACPAISVTSVVAHNAGTVSADMECTDGEGWTHYWNSTSDELVLSIKKNGNNIGTIGDGTFAVSTTDNGTAPFYADGTGFITNGVGAVLMERKWDVTATTQPSSNVDVRFYYTATNYSDINTGITNQGGTPLTAHTELNFYKVTSGEDPFAIANLSSSDIELIQNSGSAGINTWTAGTFGSDFYAEYQVASFSGGGGGGASGGVALPVEMTSFTAKAEGNVNVLNWETASEENNARFDVERSTNGVDFETIGQVEGNGTTVEVSNYNFVDETPATVSYYRLRQVDFDGNFANSEVVIVKREGGSNNVAMFPVPVQDLLTVQYSATANEEMTITVTDVTGRTVVTKAVTAIQGENQFKLNLNELPSGSYFVRLQSDNSNIIRTIVKQ